VINVQIKSVLLLTITPALSNADANVPQYRCEFGEMALIMKILSRKKIGASLNVILRGILLPIFLNVISFIILWVVSAYVFTIIFDTAAWYIFLLIYFIIAVYSGKIIGVNIPELFFSTTFIVFFISLIVLLYPLFFLLFFDIKYVFIFCIIWLACMLAGSIWGNINSKRTSIHDNRPESQ